MDGFTAQGRVERVVLRRARPAVDEVWPPDHSLVAEPPSNDASVLVDVGASEPLRDRLAGVRDRWSELTFYLFDPQSWR
jgi:hypothetical protein